MAWSADFGYATVDSEVRQVAEASARRFVELGCTVEAVDPGWDDPAPWAEIWHMNMAARFSDQLDERPEWIEPSLRTMIEAGRRTVGAGGRARAARPDRVLQPGAAVHGTLRSAAHAADAVRGLADRPPDEIDGQQVSESIFDHLPFTFPFNGTGWPAASVPCGFNAEGLPIGLQIVAPWRQDGLCLRAAAAFEALQPWHARKPV